MSDQSNSPWEIVERHWPYDGPHSSDTVTDAAVAVGQLVRYMNNATWNRQLLNGPSLYRVLSSLNATVYGLDQLLEQLFSVASRLMEDGTLYDDRRDRPAVDTVRDVAAALLAARQAFAGEPRRWIEQAAGLAYHLGHDSVRGE